MTETGITWGHARISSLTRREDRQIKKLKEFGLDERNIIVDKESGKTLERVKLSALKDKTASCGRYIGHRRTG